MLFPTVGGIREDGYSASCKTEEVYVSSFLKTVFSQPISLDKFSIDTSFDALVTIRAASFCIFFLIH